MAPSNPQPARPARRAADRESKLPAEAAEWEDDLVSERDRIVQESAEQGGRRWSRRAATQPSSPYSSRLLNPGSE